jgi:YhcH/YjgK/YiaL family protein
LYFLIRVHPRSSAVKREGTKIVIIDELTECDSYRCMSENFAAGFDYLRSMAFETIADGRYRIRGDDVFAMVQSYQTKPRDQGRWEAHRHYADIQLMVEGAEYVGVCSITRMTVAEPYTRERDVEFFIGDGRFHRLERGEFAVFLPQDVHMPGIMIATADQVKKVVVKVRI